MTKMQFLLTLDLEGLNDINNSILAILWKRNLEAIFFLEGKWIEKFPKRASQLADEFDLGNHSYSHPDFRKLDLSSQILEIKKCDDILSKIGKQKIKIFRAPLLAINKKTPLALKKMNYGYDSSIKKYFATKPSKINGVNELFVNAPSDYFLFKIGLSDRLVLKLMKIFLAYHQLSDSLVIFDFHPTQKWGIYSHIKFLQQLLDYLKEKFIMYHL